MNVSKVRGFEQESGDTRGFGNEDRVLLAFKDGCSCHQWQLGVLTVLGNNGSSRMQFSIWLFLRDPCAAGHVISLGRAHRAI